jgi:hypothetical protein
MVAPGHIAMDVDGRFYVADGIANSIILFDATATGNAPPVRTIVGPHTGLDLPFGIAITGPRTGPVRP